ncbi:MAG: GNAT family N-acetyltransferase [Actinomycetota bacterium]
MHDVEIGWRQPFTNGEANRLHAAAFETRLYTDEEWNWVGLVEANSLGWVTARDDGELVGFANVLTDGFVHAWLQDVMVSPTRQRSGIGTLLVDEAARRTAGAGCEWLHVDFDDDVADFYYRRCGFQPTNGGLLALDPPADPPPAPDHHGDA